MKTKTFIMMCGVLGLAGMIFGCGGKDSQFNPNITYGSFIDSRDGKTYRIITIGSQTWMAENLNFATASGSWCYDNDVANCEIYGRLYDWNTAMTVCPQEWRLPDSLDWAMFIDAIADSSNAGTKLRSQNGWQNNSNGTDELGFTAIPGGYRRPDGRFVTIGLNCHFWSATEFDATNTWLHRLGTSTAQELSIFHNSERIRLTPGGKSIAFSVRCVRDD